MESALLRCLGGAPAPPDMAADLARFNGLPASARERFWEALGPSLPEPLPPSIEKHLDEFCARHGADGEEVARALKAARFLLREAARTDASRDDLRADLRDLLGEAMIVNALLAGFDSAKGLVRKELLAGALRAHGTVLVGADARLDVIATTAEGARLQAPVVLLTLRTASGDEPGRLTLHAPPAALRELRDLCDRMLAAVTSATTTTTRG